MEYQIKPGIGIGSVLLGSDEESVRSLLGPPTKTCDTEHADGDLSHDWDYSALGLSLVFSGDDDFLLGTISTTSRLGVFRGINIVGMTEHELLVCDFDGIGPPMLEDDFEESGKDYCWDALNLSCWVSGDAVTSVTLMPNFDITGNIPLWPENA